MWPLSRTHYPKQFLRLVDEFSLLQNTLRRLDGLAGLGRTIAVANENHRFLVAEQLHEIGLQADLLLEPAARNTAPAVAFAAALHALGEAPGQDPPLLPEGSFSSNPYNGSVRIKEFKEMVKASTPPGLE